MLEIKKTKVSKLKSLVKQLVTFNLSIGSSTIFVEKTTRIIVYGFLYWLPISYTSNNSQVCQRLYM